MDKLHFSHPLIKKSIWNISYIASLLKGLFINHITAQHFTTQVIKFIDAVIDKQGLLLSFQ